MIIDIIKYTAAREAMGIKLSRHAFVRFLDLHAWLGVVVSLLLYFMVLTGTVSLFHDQLFVWQDPLAQSAPLAGAESQPPLRQVLSVALQGQEPTGRTFLRLPETDYGNPRVNYRAAGAEERSHVWVDTARLQRVPVREALANFLLDIHYLWHDLTGTVLFRVAGGLALAWFLLVVTGVLVHLKDIVAQFYQFRSRKSERVLWSDLHKVLGVMGLPFQLMYSYTGAFIALTGLLLSGLQGPVFGGDAARARQVRSGPGLESTAQGSASTPAGAIAEKPLEHLVARAQAAEPRLAHPTRLTLTKIGTAESRVSVRGALDGSVPRTQGMVTVSALDGSVLAVKNSDNKTPHEVLSGWVFGLHYGLFGGLTLRFLYFVMGLFACGTILTGNWVWLSKRHARRQKAGHLGAPILQRLTAGAGGGVLVAVAFLFVVSRTLPLSWAARQGIEELSFFAALLLCLGWGVLASEPRAVWRRQLRLSGTMFLVVPLLAARWSAAGLWGAALWRAEGHVTLPAVLGVDIGLSVAGLGLWAVAWQLARAPESEPTVAQRMTKVETAHA